MSHPCQMAITSFSTYPDGLIEADTTDIAGIYKPRNPQRSVLYRVVQQNLETWLASRREADPDGYPIPNYVESSFLKYLQCGIWAYGFARCRCPSCGYEFLVSFSCKTRGLCPSCNGKHMAQTAAHLIDNVLPFVPFRQVVLTLAQTHSFLSPKCEAQTWNPKNFSPRTGNRYPQSQPRRSQRLSIRSCGFHPLKWFQFKSTSPLPRGHHVRYFQTRR